MKKKPRKSLDLWNVMIRHRIVESGRESAVDSTILRLCLLRSCDDAIASQQDAANERAFAKRKAYRRQGLLRQRKRSVAVSYS
jgi:hypothetical protein